MGTARGSRAQGDVPRGVRLCRRVGGAERTAAANRAAFDRWQVVPRAFRDVRRRSLDVELFGRRLPAPVLLAPIGVLEMAHPDADLAVGRAGAGAGLPVMLSSQASVPMEDRRRHDGRRAALVPALRQLGGRPVGQLRATRRGRWLRGHRAHRRYDAARLAVPRPRSRLSAVRARVGDCAVHQRPGVRPAGRRASGSALDFAEAAGHGCRRCGPCSTSPVRTRVDSGPTCAPRGHALPSRPSSTCSPGRACPGRTWPGCAADQPPAAGQGGAAPRRCPSGRRDGCRRDHRVQPRRSPGRRLRSPPSMRCRASSGPSRPTCPCSWTAASAAGPTS